MMFIRVDFPDPDDPMMATNSPRSTVRLMPCSACTDGVAELEGPGQVDEA